MAITFGAADAPPRNRKGVRSFEHGVSVLEVLATGETPLPLRRIADGAGMARSKAHAYLVSLVRSGLAAQDERTGAYRLGPAALRLGLAALYRVDALDEARAALAGLSARLGHTVCLSVWSATGAVVVSKQDGGGESPFELRVGTRVHLTETATGRIFLAYLPPERWRRLLPRGARTEAGSIGATVRRAGFAQVAGRTLPGFAAIAAPVFDHGGELRAAVTVIGSSRTFDAGDRGPILRALRETGFVAPPIALVAGTPRGLHAR